MGNSGAKPEPRPPVVSSNINYRFYRLPSSQNASGLHSSDSTRSASKATDTSVSTSQTSFSTHRHQYSSSATTTHATLSNVTSTGISRSTHASASTRMGNSGAKPKPTPPAVSHNINYSLPSSQNASGLHSSDSTRSASKATDTSVSTSQTSFSTHRHQYSSSATTTHGTLSNVTSTGISRSTHASASTVSKANVPTVPVEGKQAVKHGVNNNYLIPKTTSIPKIETSITVPYNKSVDKFTLTVCAQYNSKSGCHAVICRRFHICYHWALDNCNRNDCTYDHSFDAYHNQIIMDSMINKRRFSTDMILESLRNNHRFNRRSKRQEPSICMFSIVKSCRQESCSLTHANKSHVWELEHNNKWILLAYNQSDVLEEHFCDPEEEVVELPSVKNIKALEKLRLLLSPEETWTADLLSMEVSNGNISYRLRRISTPSDICCMKSMNRLSTRWIWYWQDNSGFWKPFTDGCGQKFYLVNLSDRIEFHYNFLLDDEPGFEVTMGTYSYRINLRDMMQENLETGRTRAIRRRPSAKEVRSENVYFDSYFSFTSSDMENVRQKVRSNSPEFVLVKTLMGASMNSVDLISVERVVNNHLWKAYQNKKDQLKSLHNGDHSLINEQFMFHGTKYSVIDYICRENFDWKLHGDNVGHIFGRGAYFSNLASLANAYSEPRDVKIMFIALVLVGSLAIGNQDMRIPPMNMKTKCRFDTTCDDVNNSTKFVKYNRDEYYPAFIAHYKP